MYGRSRSGRQVRFGVVLLAIQTLGAGLAAEVRSVATDGPLPVRAPFLLDPGLLVFDPEGAGLPPRGRVRVEIVHSVANTWAKSLEVRDMLQSREQREALTAEQLNAIEPYDPDRGLYLLDGEISRTRLSLRGGLRDRVQLELAVPVVEINGGSTDGFIQGFHETFNRDQTGREGLHKDTLHLYLRSSDGYEIYRSEEHETCIGDPIFGFKARLPAPAPRYDLAVETLIKVPLAGERELVSSGSLDIGAQFLVSRRSAAGNLHFSVGVLHLGRAPMLALAEQRLLSGFVAWERRVASRTTFVAQISASDSPYDSLAIDILDSRSWTIDLGIRQMLGSRSRLFVALSENLPDFGSSADVGFHLGISRDF